ncbi:porin family protein [Sediminibacterium goheungense]|uniref:Outer membrane protein with beta-barrel domain n=1 Tax=Sediminibacterium goheungense TaxID=1086393 RepID=A0A4R6IYU8_9BACT|nr:porin family protein [Sediminibacterium goheungense]TDO27136.1 outer membrane protein with beta-barrel domain [Sediminibacterium goheungense]
MKKVLLAVFAVTLVTATLQAQGIRLGAKVGTNLNKVSGQSFSDGFDLAYHVGGFLEIDFNKKWGIQPEVLWSQTATKRSSFNTIYASEINPLNNQQKIKLDYLSIPVLFRYNVGGILTLNLGPQFGILLNQDKTLLQNGESAFKSGDFSMVAGGQLNFKVLRIYGRYNIGLQNINDIDNKDKWTNQQIQLGLGLRF